MQDWSNDPSPAPHPLHRRAFKQDLGHRMISQADRSLIPSIKKLAVVAEWVAGVSN